MIKSSENMHLDKLELIDNNMRSILLSNMLGAWPIGLYAGFVLSWSSAIFWLFAVHTVVIIRWLFYRQAHALGGPKKNYTWYKKYLYFFSFLSGCSWALATFLFLDSNHLGVYTYLSLTLAGMIGGCMTSVSSIPKVFDLFAIPIAVCAAGISFYQGTLFGFFIGVGILVYLAFTMFFCRKLNHSINETLSLRYENDQLVEELKVKAELEKKANRDKSFFLATASHDLRQPMHAINLFMETLKSSNVDKSQHLLLDKIQSSLDSMNELFSSLLDISKMDSSDLPLNKQGFNLGILLDKLASQFRMEITSNSVTLNYQQSQAWVYTDPLLLERILRNLISNAVHYTEKGEVNLKTRPVGDNEVEVIVEDTGCGIPQAQHDIIFNEFTQLNNPERDRNKGLGLGLAIVERLHKKLDLPLELKSEQGIGTRFALILPRFQQTQAEPQTATTEPTNVGFKGASILVIDNDVAILEATKLMLNQWSCKVTTANTSEQAIEIVNNGYTPDLIISDFRMPGDYNGIELIIELHKKVRHTSAIIISGDTSKDLIEKTHRHSLLLISKPIKPVQLNMAIGQLLLPPNRS